MGLGRCLMYCMYWDVQFKIGDWALSSFWDRFTGKNYFIRNASSDSSNITNTVQNIASQAAETANCNDKVNTLIEKTIDKVKP